MMFDTHSHLNDPDLFPQAGELIARAVDVGVQKIVVPGYDRASSLRALELADRYHEVYAAVGFHPQDASNVTEEDLASLETWCKHDKVVAIGEIGLDYHYDTTPKDVQERVFRDQIAIARNVSLPIVIHDREAHADVVRVLTDAQAAQIGGIMHCFSGSVEMMRECLALNFYISLGGPVTFKNAKKPAQVAAEVPRDRILIETDAPWLTPEPFRGKRNEPAHVQFVAARLAAIWNVTQVEVEQVTYENAMRLFNIDE